MAIPRGLFLNTLQARCSIHESGAMAYRALQNSDRYVLDYQELSRSNRRISRAYDFYIFNYHDFTSMSWLDTRCIRRLPGFKMTLVLEVAPNDPFVRVSPDDFDAYLVLDPSMARVSSRVYAFPRPLESSPDLPESKPPPIPLIGTFGLPTGGKGFDKVVLAVNREFESAVIRMNIPMGDYIDSDAPQRLSQEILRYRRLARPGVELVVTHDFMSKPDLIRWCAANTLNCFLYDRSMPGLSATTDQAIVSGRPLAVSTNETFRHIHEYLKPYPLRSLRESIELSAPEVAAMREAWSPTAFARKFEGLLTEHHIVAHQPQEGLFLLKSKPLAHAFLAPLKAVRTSDFVPPLLPKAYDKVRAWIRKTKAAEPPFLTPYAHPLISSTSQFGEDLWLDYFLGNKRVGFYVDVGANDPKFNSNTHRFYHRGWSGINIEPTVQGHRAFVEKRPRDLNLQMAVSAREEEVVLYLLSHDTTLSTLDKTQAEQMARRLGLTISQTTVPSLPLSEIFRRYLPSGQKIDFLSVDVEGTGLEVLGSHDWVDVRPAFVLVEMNQERDGIRQLMNKADYMLLINNHINGLFIDATCRLPGMDEAFDHALEVQARTR